MKNENELVDLYTAWAQRRMLTMREEPAMAAEFEMMIFGAGCFLQCHTSPENDSKVQEMMTAANNLKHEVCFR